MKSFKEIYKSAENKIAGIAAAPGIVIGEVYLFTKEKLEISKADIKDVDEAKRNFQEALEKSKKELKKIFAIAKERMGNTRAGIFEAQLMILDDPVLIDNIIKRIEEEKKQPEYIVDDEISKYQQMMFLSHESYMKERANDIEDIKNRIVRNLRKKRWQSRIKGEVIIVSDSLTPADALLLSRNNIKSFVTDHGGLTSHAAIISRSLNIPAVVGTHNATLKLRDRQMVIVDGFYGYVLFDPTEEQIAFFDEKHKHLVQLQREFDELADKPAVTKDGKEIELLANVDVTGEIDIVKTSGAKGIGLYRSEQLLDEMDTIPNEEEQALIYTRLASRIYPDSITIRAFDIGGDKFKLFDYDEPNPFLGLRGIRILLENPELFKEQVRAVLRSSVNKNVKLMLPMISTIDEINRTKEIIENCKKELTSEQIPFDKDIEVGIMVEVPAAAVMAKEFADATDFLSIGTNDLIQYLMAVDRGNDLVSDLYQEFSPVVLRTIKKIVDDAKLVGKPVSLCGEMAADTLAMPLLIGLGLESLSISPRTIPYAKRIIMSFSHADAKAMAEKCTMCCYEYEIEKTIQEFFEENQIIRTRNII
ncbi:phosphoenolpyruvate--protein phosphotransferase [bacterium BMS3Abin03]|nr:phosphoenolpyruvate--protein phosphotransferase [bacterium BMS3Abin03]MCG6961297.1 phosphoenolpyruvate--protein phosphotransferase [bacterium BMS3Abin03]